MQRQQELREYQIHQMLLAEQLDQQSRIDNLLKEQQLKAAIGEHLGENPELQQHYSQLLMNAQERSLLLAEHQLQQEAIRQRAMVAHQTAARETKLNEQNVDTPVSTKKRPRSNTNDSQGLKGKKTKKSQRKYSSPKLSPHDGSSNRLPAVLSKKNAGVQEASPQAQALLDFATALPVTPFRSPGGGTLKDLIDAADSDTKNDAAASTLVGIMKKAEWYDSEPEPEVIDPEEERKRAEEKGEVIKLPGFTSILPQLPEEPELIAIDGDNIKRKGLLDDDSVQSKAKTKPSRKDSIEQASSQNIASDSSGNEYPYPLDTWWPSPSSIRREKKLSGDHRFAERIGDNENVFGKDAPFTGNVELIRQKLAHEVQPGVLEKVPHCRIHRMAMKKRKNPSAPELVCCFQVTELYPNDVMVCCSHCGTWRHAACGGHHKPYSVRETIDTPFVAVCDRCHEEEKIVGDYPLGRKRLERQRMEQIRRGLATSATMRQASFSKHGGTYKWPLGSVSATHIGGHTRSVHSRHDKAEKQWRDMANRLGRNNSMRPKERAKVRTKELERLLASVEDAEGHTDRHNMMLFLLQDTLRKHPVGFEKQRRNIFDPEDEYIPTNESESEEIKSEKSTEKEEETTGRDSDAKPCRKSTTCSRHGCNKKPRFDSLFCSDACGVSALESDLLRTFQYASDIHPSLFRN